MTPQQRTILRNYALATLGTGAVAVSLFFGGFDAETNRPTPITVDGETIEFTWTDDNTDEDLIIYTDKRDYNNGFSQATVYAAVTNQSGVDQDVSLMGSFVNERRKIKDVAVLTTATFASTSTAPGTCYNLTGAQLQKQLDAGEDPADYYITETTATGTPGRTFEVCTQVETVSYATSTKWVPLPQTKRDIYEVAIEQGYLDKLSTVRKSVDGYIAENKTLAFPIKAGQTLYYKLELEYPANDSGNFFLEAIGSEGAYGNLDPWFNASWTYRVSVTVNASQVDSTLSSFPVYVDLSDLPAGFFTNAKSDGCDIRVVESDETTETAFELVAYDSGGSGELHFMADSLSSSADTVFYIYYGNSGASCYGVTDTYGRNNVWGDYKAVLHFNESTGSNAVDSVGSGDWTDNNSVDSTTGVLGLAKDFTKAGSDHFETTKNLTGGMSALTVSYWFKRETETAPAFLWSFERQANANDAYNNWANLGDSTNKKIDFGLENDSGQRTIITSTATFNTGTWYLAHQTWDGSTMRQFFDGSVDATTGSRTGTFSDNTVQKFIGGNDAQSLRYYDGVIDEVRVRQSYVGADWIAAEHVNQSTPTTFYTVGTQETDGGGGGAARRIIRTTQF